LEKIFSRNDHAIVRVGYALDVQKNLVADVNSINILFLKCYNF